MYSKLNLFTHDGLFHADDVFATAMLSMIADDIHVVRGGDDDVPTEEGWIVYDIGGGELDHHSPENKETNGCHPDTNIPYASCGLVWKKYYQEILQAQDCPEAYYDKVYQKLENSLIIGIDAADNGVNPVMDALNNIPNISDDQRKHVISQANYGYTVSQIIKDFNPTWNSTYDHYDAFLDAVSFAKDILYNRIDSIISALDARDHVLRCISYSADHIMIMDKFAPWEGILNSQKFDPKAQDIWYVVYPALRGGWNVQCALSDPDDRTSYRHPLPKEWYGLRGKELADVCGVEGAIFCHVSGFLAGANDQTEALTMAGIACRTKQ